MPKQKVNTYILITSINHTFYIFRAHPREEKRFVSLKIVVLRHSDILSHL